MCLQFPCATHKSFLLTLLEVEHEVTCLTSACLLLPSAHFSQSGFSASTLLGRFLFKGGGREGRRGGTSLCQPPGGTGLHFRSKHLKLESLGAPLSMCREQAPSLPPPFHLETSYSLDFWFCFPCPFGGGSLLKVILIIWGRGLESPPFITE